MPLDPFADSSRRAWFPCPHCHHGRGCPECGAGQNCDRHWQYLLGNTATVVHLQCPSCAYLWEHDTRRAA
jgi:hypothetical protein